MKDAIKKDYDRDRDLRHKAFEAVCYAPFGGLYFSPVGNVGFCCHTQGPGSYIGNVSDARLDDIWNGKKAQAIRTAVRHYAFPKPACQFCRWQFDSGNFSGIYAKKYDTLHVGDGPEWWPTRMEFAMSNVCNFACTMCSGEHSSTIRKKIEKLPPIPKYYDDTFFADLEKYVPHLREVAFLGGEPFLATENYRVWEMLVDNGMGGNGTHVNVVTNGSIYNSKVEKVLDELPFHINISLEGVRPETQDAIRVNSKWDEVERNVHRFREYTRERGTDLTIAHCLMVQNWYAFPEVVEFAEQIDAGLYVNVVTGPETHSLYHVPTEQLEEITAKMEADLERTLPRIKRNREPFEVAVRSLRSFLDAKREKRTRSHGGGAKKIDGAWQLGGQGKFDAALRVVDTVAETDPDYYTALVAGGHFLRRSGELPPARERLDRAIALEPARPEAYIERAWLNLDQGELDAGIADAEKAREIDVYEAFEAEIWHPLGFLFGEKGMVERSREAFDHVVTLRPGDATSLIHRAWCLMRAGCEQEARADLEEALRHEPENSEARDTLARLSA